MPHSVYIETYGCAFNFADSETLGALLSEAGWRLVDEEAEAGVVVLNSCTVKDRTYLDFRKRLAALRQAPGSDRGPAVVVAGCAPLANPDEELLRDVPCVGANDLASIVPAVEAAAEGRAFRRLQRNGEATRLALPSRRRNPAVEILPINHGCLSACAFCQARLARGRLVSFPIRDIVDRARRAAAEGVCEIRLTSQDTGAYGADIGVSLPDLLEALVEIDGDFRIRLGMSSPQWLRRDLDRLLNVFESPRLYQFLHAPVQSGSDRVLRAMRRGHTAGDFQEIGAAFRERFPRIALWTDIIAGFPTETDGEFESSLDLLRRTRPATVNRSRFSARPGTAAAQMPQLPSRVVSERSRRLNEVVEEISAASLAEWIGWEGPVWISEVKRPGSAVARNYAYRPIVLEGQWKPGRRTRARIVGQTTFHLLGEPVKGNGRLAPDGEGEGGGDDRIRTDE